MGQYYHVIFLADKGTSKNEVIRAFALPWFGNGAKLTEHSYINNPFVNAVEYFLSPEGMFYKTRIVWAGDYADNEVGLEQNLHTMCEDYPNKELKPSLQIPIEYKYIINHTKKQYVNKDKYKSYHPLPLLTAEGNGRGGGDYKEDDEEYVGIWSRDVISIEKNIPSEYVESNYFQNNCKCGNNVKYQCANCYKKICDDGDCGTNTVDGYLCGTYTQKGCARKYTTCDVCLDDLAINESDLNHCDECGKNQCDECAKDVTCKKCETIYCEDCLDEHECD